MSSLQSPGSVPLFISLRWIWVCGASLTAALLLALVSATLIAGGITNLTGAIVFLAISGAVFGISTGYALRALGPAYRRV